VGHSGRHDADLFPLPLPVSAERRAEAGDSLAERTSRDRQATQQTTSVIRGLTWQHTQRGMSAAAYTKAAADVTAKAVQPA
jgi:hypothetical protein